MLLLLKTLYFITTMSTSAFYTFKFAPFQVFHSISAWFQTMYLLLIWLFFTIPEDVNLTHINCQLTFQMVFINCALIGYFHVCLFLCSYQCLANCLGHPESWRTGEPKDNDWQSLLWMYQWDGLQLSGHHCLKKLDKVITLNKTPIVSYQIW